MEAPKGDYGYYLNFTITDSDGDAYDLTDYTIKLKCWRAGNPGKLVVNGSCTPVVEASGTCRYYVTATDFTTIEKYVAELELTKSGVIESTMTFTINVVESG